MECQSTVVPGDLSRALSREVAPVDCSTIIRLASCIGFSRSLVHPHRREVSSLSGRVMLQPVSLPLQEGLRFVPPPYPHRHQLGLPPPYPVTRERYGLTTFHKIDRTGEVLSIRR